MTDKKDKNKNKDKKISLKAIFLIMVALPIVSASVMPIIAHALSLSSITEGVTNFVSGQIDHVLYGNTQYAEGWGIYFANLLANTIHGGFLYYIAFIMFIWGMWNKLFPPGFISLSLEVTNYFGTFMVWIVYFFIVFFLVGTPYSSKINPVRNITYLADTFTNQLALLLNGDNDPNMNTLISKQIRKLSVNQYSTIDYLTPKVRQEVADFEKTCTPTNNSLVSGLGKFAVAVPSITQSAYASVKYVDFEGLNAIAKSCSNKQDKVYKDVLKAFNARIEKIAEERGYNADLKTKQEFIASVKAKIERKGFASLTSQMGCMPLPSSTSGSDSINKYATAVPGATFVPCASAETIPSGKLDEEALVAGLLKQSPVQINLYNKIRSDLAEGQNSSLASGIKHVWGIISSFVKASFGAITLVKVELTLRAILPYAIQIGYMLNAMVYGFLIIFLPLVMTIALQSEKSIGMIIKYLFLLIWAKSWVIPISLFTNFYLNYIDTGVGTLTGPVLMSILLFLAPTLMGIILLEGSAAIGKIDSGLDKMLTVAGGLTGTMAASLYGKFSGKLFGGGDGGDGPTGVAGGEDAVIE